MGKLDDYVMLGSYDKFKEELLGGILGRAAYCDEIMRNAFDKGNHTIPILSPMLADMYEKAINELLAENKIVASTSFKGINGKATVFTTSYKKV